MGVELFWSMFDPGLARRNAQVRSAPDLHHGSHWRGVAHPGASPATGTHWWLTASIPQARSAERHPGCAPHRLGLALDAARSAPLADSLSDLSRVAYGWHL